VAYGDGSTGVVVCSIDSGEYSSEYPEDQWSYLSSEVLVKSDDFGLIHYELPDDDLRLLRRGGA